MPEAVPEIVVAPEQFLRARFRALVREAHAHAAGEARRFSLAIPGGSVVPRLLGTLDDSTTDWTACDLFWCDERAVAADHPDSNYGASMAGWLGALSETGIAVHRMAADGSSLDEDAQRYEQTMRKALGEAGVLDVVVVGVGEDGHVCSLFPRHGALGESARWVVAVDDAPKPPPRRLSFTLPVLAQAHVLVVAAFGIAKRDAMREALDDRASTLPVAQALRAARRSVVLLDEDAAGNRRA